MDGERLFCDVGLARRIEHAEARFVAACSDAARARLGDDAGFTRPLADGVASFAEAGSPFTKVAGLGFAGLPDLTELEEWLAEVADASLVADTEGLPSHEDFPRELLVNALRNMAGVRRYLAVRDGEFAGGASFRVTDGIAQFTGAATVPAHRRRGVQTALLQARLAAAAEARCDIAVVTTQPGSKSQQNVQRQGFDLLYARAILVKGTSATRSSGAESRQAS